MKNKVLLSGVVVLLALVMGTTVYAVESNVGFDQMLPMMKQVHPELSDGQLLEMYEFCHGDSAR